MAPYVYRHDGHRSFRNRAWRTHTKKKFSELLKEIIGPDCKDRPFVCDGFPCQSEAIIIGDNPATELGINWWDLWDEGKGFNFEAFRLLRKPKKRGARLRMGWLRNEHGINCVETNVHRNEKPHGHGPIPVRNDRVIEILLDNMPRLRAVIIHGKNANTFIEKHAGITAAIAGLERSGIGIFRTPHFCRVSRDGIRDISDRIKLNRLATCPQCGDDSASECKGN